MTRNETTRLSVPTTAERCEDCGWVSNYGGAHWCNPQHQPPASACEPQCWYCWGPVAQKVGRYGQLKGWQDFCSDTCKKLASRPLGTGKVSATTRDLIVQVAGSSEEAAA